jgi:DMSO/TMAO reductase YedYZ heme-binding membrane subunit
MTATVSPYLWYTTRATGTVALVLLSATMVLGMLTATRVGGTAVPRFAVGELHRRVSLLSMVFLAVHIFTAVVDTYVPIGWWAAVVPFTSHYQPLYVGLGAVAFDLLLAVLATSLLRSRLPAPWWRGVHWLVYACWPVAVVHAVLTGTDLRFGWMDVVVACCILSVLVALGWRLYAHPHRGGLRTARQRRRTTGVASPAVPVVPVRPVPGRPVPAGRVPVRPVPVRPVPVHSAPGQSQGAPRPMVRPGTPGRRP